MTTHQHSAWVSFPGAPYTQEAALKACQRVLYPRGWQVNHPPATITEHGDATCQPPSGQSLYLADYDLLPFEDLLPISHQGSPSQCSSYVIRKALIRKHYLANAIKTFNVKNRSSSFSAQPLIPPTWNIDIQFADELEEFLMDDGYDLAEILQRNQEILDQEAEEEEEGEEEKAISGGNLRKSHHDRRIQWFILKPGMADRGNGIRIFSTTQQLVDIFEEFEEDEEQEEDEDEGEEEEDGEDDLQDRTRKGQNIGNGLGKDTSVMTSQLRHFVIQEYISNPLTIRPPRIKEEEEKRCTTDTERGQDSEARGGGRMRKCKGRKFHLRAYVLCVGSLKVYLHKDMLALFSPRSYRSPGQSDFKDLSRHLTNTCLQSSTEDQNGKAEERGEQVMDDCEEDDFRSSPEENVHLWRDLVGSDFDLEDAEGQEVLTEDMIRDVEEKVARLVGDSFKAAAKAGSVHWQMWPNAFEIFGVDVLVNWKDVDGEGKGGKGAKELGVWLLEVNAQPDFAQTGQRLKETIDRLFERTCQLAVLPFHHHPTISSSSDPEEEDQGGVKDSEAWEVGQTRDGTVLCFQEEVSKGW
ncbi:TTL-domain-containing protein [Violaceomyces palustris]|uniref:TTL-domain-containing protein n=1 Tax=Violaceomyces palustris TaxID=1673888 RepID=A0ACD0NUW9_9BASI|nr:TTL-domain-containing protein [Violaceomyces palustris]